MNVAMSAEQAQLLYLAVAGLGVAMLLVIALVIYMATHEPPQWLQRLLPRPRARDSASAHQADRP